MKVLILILFLFLNNSLFSQSLTLADSVKIDFNDKVMLLKSANELQTFNRQYNNSLILTGCGIALTTIAVDVSPESSSNFTFIVAGAFFLSAAVLNISAHKHIGRSGAYLEAYANGVTIHF